jgi:hypothetical protein
MFRGGGSMSNSRLWYCEQTYRVTCESIKCAGGYLTLAIKHSPNKRKHLTALNVWTRVTASEATNRWMVCEGCGARQANMIQEMEKVVML